MNPRRAFLYGFALGIMLATVSSYYHFCRPLKLQQGQSLSEVMPVTSPSGPSVATDRVVR